MARAPHTEAVYEVETKGTGKAPSEDDSTIIGASTAQTTPEMKQGPYAHDMPTARPQTKWEGWREKWQDVFCEFFGTFILILFGNGSVAQVVLAKGEKGEYQSISWGWGIGVFFGVYCGGKSGAHINPAVTLVLCVFRKHPWKKFLPYVLAQMFGAAIASAIVWANYKSAIALYEGGAGILTVPGESETPSAVIFCTYPAEFMTRTGMFFSEFIATTILMFCLFALKDDGNLGAGNLTPLALLFLIFGIGATFGWETGYAINPARDFGPRLMSAMLGYGKGVWSAGGYYFWIPIVSPLLGGLFGAFMYDVFIFTGESPINTPWWGLRHPLRQQVWSDSVV